MNNNMNVVSRVARRLVNDHNKSMTEVASGLDSNYKYLMTGIVLNLAFQIQADYIRRGYQNMLLISCIQDAVLLIRKHELAISGRIPYK